MDHDFRRYHERVLAEATLARRAALHAAFAAFFRLPLRLFRAIARTRVVASVQKRSAG